jgi:hypothetical protein
MQHQYYLAVNPSTEEPQVSTKNLQLPFEWWAGTFISLVIVFVPAILWMGRIRTDINVTQKELDKHKIEVAKEFEDTRKNSETQRQNDRATFSSELKISSQEIINQFNLISQEFRLSMIAIGEKITKLGQDQHRKEETVNHLRNDLKEIKEREREANGYLKQMRQYIPAVDRRDQGNISKPGEFTR